MAPVRIAAITAVPIHPSFSNATALIYRAYLFMKTRLVIATVLFIFANANAQESRVNCRAAERDLEIGIHSWYAAYRYFKQYKEWCSDGALAEYLSGSFSTLMDKKWSTLPELQRLSTRDPDFLRWVLMRNFSDAEDDMASCRINERLTRCCPSGAQTLCKLLIPRVFASREEKQMCMSSTSNVKTCTGK